MALRRVRPLDLLPRVENLQRQNRQPVDHQPRRFRIQFRPWFWQLRSGQRFEQQRVALLRQIVPPLVDRVDGPLHADDLGIRRARHPRLIFNMP